MKNSRYIAAALAMSSSFSTHAQDDLVNSSDSAVEEEAKPSTKRGVPHAIGDRLYLAPMASYVFTDSNRGTDNGLGGTLLFGKLFQSRFGVEMEVHYSEYDEKRGAGKAKLMSGGLRGVLFPIEGAAGYVTGGLGYGRFKNHPGSNPDYDTTLWTVGGGYMFGPFDLLLPDLSVRTELVFRSDMHDGDSTSKTYNNALNELVASVGLMIPLGSVPASLPPPSEPPIEVVPVVDSVDSDGDGVTDDLDKCLDTPTGTVVGADGCPIPTAAPDCDTPEPGQPITVEGCAAGDKIVLRGVNFEFNHAQLTPNAQGILDGISDALVGASNVRVEIGGHTDARESDKYNKAPSARRAESVLRYLVDEGIDRSRMESRGYCAAEPVADNEADEGHELNRRVELKIIS